MLGGILFFQTGYSQLIKEQRVSRLKGGGSALYNFFTFTFEEGAISADTTKLVYTKKNRKKQHNDLVLLYKDIYTIKRLNALIIFPNKLLIRMKNGSFYYFGTYRRKKIIEIVRAHIEVDNW